MTELGYATLLKAAKLPSISNSSVLSAVSLSAPDHKSENDISHTQVKQKIESAHLLLQTHQEPLHVAPVWMKPVPEPQIILLESGAMKMELMANGVARRYHAKTGHLFLTGAQLESYQLQWNSVSAQPIHTIHVYVSNNLLIQTASELTGVDESRFQLQEKSCIVDPLLQQISYSLSQELKGSPIGSTLFIETAAQLVAVHLLRNHCSIQYKIAEPQPRKLTTQQHRLIQECILNHLDETIPLKTLADLVFLSPFHFCRLFKHTTGMSPNQYVISERMKKARLLLATGQTVAQAAFAVGYQSPSHFAQLFQRHVGCAPAQYPQRIP